MKKYTMKFLILLALVLFLAVTVLEAVAHARAGGGRSYGSRGARSYSRPVTPYSIPSQPRPQMAPAPNTYQPQQSGGFLRSMAGGMMGGLLGGMLFSSLGFAGHGGMTGGGGFGLFEILLLAGIGYLIFRFMKRKTGT